MPLPITVHFLAGPSGPWQIDSINSVIGEALPRADRLTILENPESQPATDNAWTLRGITSNTRYTNRPEVSTLAGKQAGLARPAATRAALIPIRKTPAWWDLAQDERRAIFEEQSHHIGIGLDYLPAVARRLHHSRELGGPFDFLTWFEYAPEHEQDFNVMLHRLRNTPEWTYIDREVDVRLSRFA